MKIKECMEKRKTFFIWWSDYKILLKKLNSDNCLGVEFRFEKEQGIFLSGNFFYSEDIIPLVNKSITLLEKDLSTIENDLFGYIENYLEEQRILNCE